MLDEEWVKRLTGGDPITARFLYKEFFTFLCTTKFWITANDAPRIKVGDAALFRRILRTPFDHQMTPAIPGVKEWMKSPKAAMQWLALAVRGVEDWRANGLRPPEQVLESTQAYKDEVDPIREFVAYCCVEGDSGKLRASAKDLYETYRKYVEGEKFFMSQKTFGTKMVEKYERKFRDGVTWYYGVGLQVAEGAS